MEIRGPGSNFDQPIEPQGPKKTEGASGADKAGFQKAMGAGQTGATQGGGGNAGGAGPVRPNFDRIASRITEGLSKGESKEQILEGVVDDHLTQQFGDKATTEMTATVTEKFTDDPQLSQIFNRLYSQAKGASQ